MTPSLTLADLSGQPASAPLRRLRSLLAGPSHVLVVTGAGCSVDSGLPVFTGPNGLYADPAVAALSHVDRLPGSLPHLWQLWGAMRPRIQDVRPHAGHLALARWAEGAPGRGGSATIATQNVDDLHERAGTDDVAHLHGRIDTTRCTRCPHQQIDDWHAYPEPPQCPRCGAALRPGLVLFGEQPDLDAAHRAKRAVRTCELYLAVGTSGVVSTSTGLLRYARDVGALTVCVDPADAVDERYDLHLRGTAADVLPALLP